MRHDPTSIKLGLQHIVNRSIAPSQFRNAALEALAYIRHLEGELRRQGFTDYNDTEKEDTDGQ